MLLADYSGVEVRVLAELSDDPQLRHDMIYGDVHAAGASQINNIPLEEFRAILKDENNKHYRAFKAMRTKAKVFTFRLTYGAGDAALADSLHCSVDEASEAVAKWAARYPKAYAYRFKMFDQMKATGGYLPVCDGRTIKVFRDDQTMPVAANYPIQGAAASVMYRAMYRVRRNFVDNDIPAYIAATVHDELLSYSPPEYAEVGMQQQLLGMEQGWLDIFPGTDTANLTDWKIGTSWADKP